MNEKTIVIIVVTLIFILCSMNIIKHHKDACKKEETGYSLRTIKVYKFKETPDYIEYRPIHDEKPVYKVETIKFDVVDTKDIELYTVPQDERIGGDLTGDWVINKGEGI